MTEGGGRLRFEGRVVAITGAAHGMGRAHALLLARRGAKLLVNDIAGADDTVALIKAGGGEAIANRADVTVSAQTDQLVEQALSAWGRLDAIINNAAIYGETFPDPDTTQRVIGVHLIGAINMMRSALPAFRRQAYGRVLNIGSGSMFGLANCGAYAAGKGGVFAFTRSFAREFGSDPASDIRANIILPAAQTPVMPRVPDEAFQRMLDTSFAPESISPIVALLVHEACPAQGEAIHVGGGRHARILLATTEGWQAPDHDFTPEDILAHWDAVMSNADPREPVGSMSDFFARRGLHPYSTYDLFMWARTGKDPAEGGS